MATWGGASQAEGQQIVCNEEKNEFFGQEIGFLGHVVMGDGIKLDMREVKAIQEWKWPLTQN